MITIYTDGSSIGNPGPGGRGVLILKSGELGIKHDIEIAGGDQRTTNNRMELMALIKSLEWIEQAGYINKPITIHMDSMYVHDGIEKYLAGWIARGRKLANKKPVLNRDLREIIALVLPKYTDMSWKRVKAHASNKYNNAVDNIARQQALSMQKSLPADFKPPLSLRPSPQIPQKSLF